MTTPFALRPYQSDLIARTRDSLRRHVSVLVQLPTGGGKTAMGAYMTSGATARGKRTWFLCHRDFLIEQTLAAFRTVGISCGVIAAGYGYNPFVQVHVVSIPTLARRYQKLTPPDFAIVDECHHAASRTWATIIAWMRTAGTRIVGLTATPARLDGKGLDDFFSDMVTGPSVADLIGMGFLSPYRAFAPSRPDLDAVHTRAGDYAKDELDAVMDTSSIVGDIVGHYRRLAHDHQGRPLRAIYFAVSVRNSQHIAATFNQAGVAARHLDAGSSTVDRTRAAVDLSRGAVAVLTNCDLFGEGYDLSAQAGRDVSVEAVGLARPTQSLVLHCQQIGRALRPKDGGQAAVILDHAGNCQRHGLPDTPREWSLTGIDPAARRKATDTLAVRQCPACFAVHMPRPSCPECGHVYVIEGRQVDEVDGELQEIDPAIIQFQRRREQGMARDLASLEEFARQRGYKPGWARHVWEARQRKEQARG